jgi:hypothetical protein
MLGKDAADLHLFVSLDLLCDDDAWVASGILRKISYTVGRHGGQPAIQHSIFNV